MNRNSKPQVKGVTLIESDRHNLGDKLKNLHFDVVADITAYDAQDIIELIEYFRNLQNNEMKFGIEELYTS